MIFPKYYVFYKYINYNFSEYFDHYKIILLSDNKDQLEKEEEILNQYKEKFINELRNHNITLDVDPKKIQFLYSELDDTTIASCNHETLNITINVKNNSPIFIVSNNLITETLVFHELSHCALGLMHRPQKDHIMNPTLENSLESIFLIKYSFIFPNILKDPQRKFENQPISPLFLNHFFNNFKQLQKRGYKHPIVDIRAIDNNILYDIMSTIDT